MKRSKNDFVLQEEKQFYKPLYTSKNVNAEEFLHSPFFKQNINGVLSIVCDINCPFVQVSLCP